MRHARVMLAWPVSAASSAGLGWGSGNKNNNNNSNNNNNYSTPVVTEFAHRAAALKRRHRGKGQYEFARREAEKFLEEEVPQNGINIWMEKGNNAVALSQVLGFFEIEPDASLQSLITNKLVRTIDDVNYDKTTRLLAAIALTQRGEQHLDRIFSAVENILSEEARDHTNGSSKSNGEGTQIWSILELAAKVLQRGGKHTPSLLNETLARMVMAQLQRTPTTEMPYLQGSLLRVYGWMVRTGKVAEANHLLIALVDHTGDFHAFDFSTLMNSCLRHNQLSQLPLQLLHRMTHAGLMYATNVNGRDAASILGSTAKILGSLEPGKNGVTERDVCELGGRMNMLLGEYEARVLRFLDSNDKLHWDHCDDVTSIVFAYEMGGRLRYRHVFVAYQNYVAKNVHRFEPQQLAIAAGILRRSHLLSQELASKLGERIETVLGEFSLSEICHICATFAPMNPAWMPEAKAVACRLLLPECSNYTKLTLAMAFPDDETLHTQINYKEISGRQLVDAISLAKNTKFEGLVVAELITRLNAAQERFSPDDLRLLQATGRQDVQSACLIYLSQRFAEPEWNTDTLYSLPLAVGIPHARDPAKALAAAKAISIAPGQFVSLVELLTSVFGDTADEALLGFVITGGMDLLQASRIQVETVIRYLEAVRPSRKMYPNAEWIARFNERFSRSLHNIKLKDVRSLLWSLRMIYGDVAQQPLLQQTLMEVVEGSYRQCTQPNEEIAEVTVLIAHLQNGMPQPPLTESTPIIVSLRSSASNYRQEIKDAILSMPLPKEVEKKRVGRFTLKAVRALEETTKSPPSAANPEVQDMNDMLNMDPFASPTPITTKTTAETSTGMDQSPSIPVTTTTTNTTTTTTTVPVGDVKTTEFASTRVVPSENSTQTTGTVPVADINTEPQQSQQQQQPQAQQQQEPQRRPVEPTLASPMTSQGISNTTPSSTHSGATLWNFFSGFPSSSSPPPSSQQQQQQPQQQQQQPQVESVPTFNVEHQQSSSVAATPTLKPVENPHVSECAPGSSYMKLFAPGFSNPSHDSIKKDSMIPETTNTFNNEERLQPRRTNLPRIDSTGQTPNMNTTTATTPSYQYEQRKNHYDGWNTSPNANANANTNTMNANMSSVWASAWNMSNRNPTMPPSSNMGRQNTFWSPTPMQTSMGMFGVGGGSSSSVPFGAAGQVKHHHHQQQQPQQPQQPQEHHHQQQQQQQQQQLEEQQRQQEQQQQQQQSVSLSNRMSPRMNNMSAPGNHLFVDPATSVRSRPVITKKNPGMRASQVPASSLDEDINQMYAKNERGANEGVSNFMKKTGLSRITGYNMGSTEGETDYGDKKGFWADAVKKCTKPPSKRRKSLSDWLNAPSAHEAPTTPRSRTTAAASAAASTARNKAKEKGKKGNSKDSHTSTATTTTTTTTSTTGSTGSGRGNTSTRGGKQTGGKAAAAKNSKGAAAAAAAKTKAKTPTRAPAKQAANTTSSKTKKIDNKKVVKKKIEKKPVVVAKKSKVVKKPVKKAKGGSKKK
ncbi:Monooxygenase [Trypanosoma theileri]|uniref:Monooxygenase n=1 Tax=Trypanosoma theileri TaxID=67003 RepID=A0A1X0NY55_9TRYP|nr:Monooxygenase [Trypanosoma theileri]ORC89614.1 Monooxygenase [Trypanosoma theileri]